MTSKWNKRGDGSFATDVEGVPIVVRRLRTGHWCIVFGEQPPYGHWNSSADAKATALNMAPRKHSVIRARGERIEEAWGRLCDRIYPGIDPRSLEGCDDLAGIGCVLSESGNRK